MNSGRSPGHYQPPAFGSGHRWYTLGNWLEHRDSAKILSSLRIDENVGKSIHFGRSLSKSTNFSTISFTILAVLTDSHPSDALARSELFHN
jgi:hypothetical protein